MKSKRVNFFINISTDRKNIEIITNLLIEALEPIGLTLVQQHEPYMFYETDESDIELTFTDGQL